MLSHNPIADDHNLAIVLAEHCPKQHTLTTIEFCQVVGPDQGRHIPSHRTHRRQQGELPLTVLHGLVGHCHDVGVKQSFS